MIDIDCLCQPSPVAQLWQERSPVARQAIVPRLTIRTMPHTRVTIVDRDAQLSKPSPRTHNWAARRAADLACEWTWLTVVVIINVQLLLSGGGCYYQWPLVVTLVSSRSRCPSSSPAPPDQPFFSLWLEILFSEILLLVFDLIKSNFRQKLLCLPIANVKAFFPLKLWMTVKDWVYKH